MPSAQVENPKVVSRIAARKELLSKEKEMTRLRDQINQQRLELPWVKVEKNYVFDAPEGKRTLADLFDGRSQLIVNHFMFGPGWKEGCVGCSFGADHVDGMLVHLRNHDVSYVAVSRAPLSEIQAFHKRMGWRFPWMSSFGTDFNYDFHVSFTKEAIAEGKIYYNYEMQDFQIEELPGTSVFYKDSSGNIFHTYSSYARGADYNATIYVYLDFTPKGRDENGPTYGLADWAHHHDRYNAGGFVAPTGCYVAAESSESGCGCAKDHA